MILEVSSISKTIATDFWKKPVVALQDVSFSITDTPGLYGIVGPNGAGKTTTIKILLGLLRPSQGYVKLFGQNPRNKRARERLGYLPESAYYYDFLTARELLMHYGALFSIKHQDLRRRTAELLDRVGLSNKADEKLRGYSKGMLQRVGLAQALINDPKFLVLDEPMSGLDPMGRHDVKELMLSLREEGKTVLFSSHILHDIETLCDQVIMISKGKLISQGPIQDLLRGQDEGGKIQLRLLPGAKLPEPLNNYHPCTSHQSVSIVVNTYQALCEILSIVARHPQSIELMSLNRGTDSFEDLFVKMAKESS